MALRWCHNEHSTSQNIKPPSHRTRHQHEALHRFLRHGHEQVCHSLIQTILLSTNHTSASLRLLHRTTRSLSCPVSQPSPASHVDPFPSPLESSQCAPLCPPALLARPALSCLRDHLVLPYLPVLLPAVPLSPAFLLPRKFPRRLHILGIPNQFLVVHLSACVPLAHPRSSSRSALLPRLALLLQLAQLPLAVQLHPPGPRAPAALAFLLAPPLPQMMRRVMTMTMTTSSSR